MGWVRNWSDSRTTERRGPKRSVPFAFEHGMGCKFCEQAQGRDRSNTKTKVFRCATCNRSMSPVMMQLTHHEQKQGWIGFRRWMVLGYTLEVMTLTEFIKKQEIAMLPEWEF